MPNTEQTENDGAEARRLAALVAGASVLQVAESMLPHPLPGVRLGLANIMTLVALVYLGPGPAVGLVVVRTLVSSIILGTFLSPAFWLSFAGGLGSTAVMTGLFIWSERFGRAGFSLIGISVAGAATHMLAQVTLVYLVFIRSPGVLLLWPWLGLGAVATGIVTGLIAVQAVARIDESGDEIRAQNAECRVQNGGGGHRDAPATGGSHIPVEVKLIAVVVFGLVVVFWANYWFYGAAFAMLIVLSLPARAGLRPLTRNLARLWPLALAALVMPLFFTNSGRVLLTLGSWHLTTDGVGQGVTFCCRLILLYFATSLLAETTTPARTATALGRLLRPLRVVGIRPDQLAQVLALSWEYFGRFWGGAKALVAERSVRLTSQSRFGRLVRLPGDIVAALYLMASEEGAA